MKKPNKQALDDLYEFGLDLFSNEPTTKPYNIDYKPGYGPNGSALQRLLHRCLMGLIVIAFLAVPVITLLGIWALLTRLL